MNRDINETLQDWSVPPAPGPDVLEGRYARLERLDKDRHAADLFAANAEDEADRIWDYLPYGPFASLAAYHRWMRDSASGEDPYFYAIQNKETGRFCGVASYLRINPESGSIEVGHINWAKRLQKTKAATEAIYLTIKWAFENGYRRFEWKCNALNMG